MRTRAHSLPFTPLTSTNAVRSYLRHTNPATLRAGVGKKSNEHIFRVRHQEKQRILLRALEEMRGVMVAERAGALLDQWCVTKQIALSSAQRAFAVSVLVAAVNEPEIVRFLIMLGTGKRFALAKISEFLSDPASDAESLTHHTETQDETATVTAMICRLEELLGRRQRRYALKSVAGFDVDGKKGKPHHPRYRRSRV